MSDSNVSSLRLHASKRNLFCDEAKLCTTNTTEMNEKIIQPAVTVTDVKHNIRYEQNTIIVDITSQPFRDIFDLLETKDTVMERYKQKYSTKICPSCRSYICIQKLDIMVTHDILIPDHYEKRIHDTPNDITTKSSMFLYFTNDFIQ
jgi:hypothetical protein